MSNTDEDTDPHASEAPLHLSGERQFVDTLSNLLDTKLLPMVNIQLEQNAKVKHLEERVNRIEWARVVAPTIAMTIAAAALIVAIIALALISRTGPLGAAWW